MLELLHSHTSSYLDEQISRTRAAAGQISLFAASVRRSRWPAHICSRNAVCRRKCGPSSRIGLTSLSSCPLFMKQTLSPGGGAPHGSQRRRQEVSHSLAFACHNCALADLEGTKRKDLQIRVQGAFGTALSRQGRVLDVASSRLLWANRGNLWAKWVRRGDAFLSRLLWANRGNKLCSCYLVCSCVKRVFLCNLCFVTFCWQPFCQH